MTQRLLAWSVSAGLCIALLATSVVRAQDDLPPGFPKIKELDELQKEIEQFQREVQRLLEVQGVPNRRFAAGEAGQLRWGGLRLKKVSAEQTETLGLPENEGLVVVSVDANTPAAKAGVKPNDILVKVGGKAVPSETGAFTKLVKDNNAANPVDLVVVRDGKEQTLENVTMPVVVQAMPNFGGARAGAFMVPRININRAFPNPFPQAGPQPGGIQNLQLEMMVNGAKISRKQTNDQFSGQFVKDEVKINVTGTLQNGQPTITEVTVQEGNESKKYTKLSEVPAQHRATVQQHLLPRTGGVTVPLMQGLPAFPDLLPIFPGIDD